MLKAHPSSAEEHQVDALSAQPGRTGSMPMAGWRSRSWPTTWPAGWRASAWPSVARSGPRPYAGGSSGSSGSSAGSPDRLAAFGCICRSAGRGRSVGPPPWRDCPHTRCWPDPALIAEAALGAGASLPEGTARGTQQDEPGHQPCRRTYVGGRISWAGRPPDRQMRRPAGRSVDPGLGVGSPRVVRS